jgi:hypothetical protein
MGSHLDPMTIVADLAELPHRGAGTPHERRAADILASCLEQLGATVARQQFRTPKAYVWLIWWLVGGIAAGLLLVPVAPWPAFFLVVACAGMAFLYFDWRSSPISRLPPQTTSENVIGKALSSNGGVAEPGRRRRKLILMAHYDSAPASLLYLPSMVKGLRAGLLINMGLMLVSVAIALLAALHGGQSALSWLRWILAIYFLGQGVITSVDYLRYGYTNGAADNASGVAAAVGTFERLLKKPIPGWDLEIVLTGAEEVIMVGAKAYYRSQLTRLDPESTYVLNFDNVGAGDLKVITRTGSITPVVYTNPLVRAALATATTEPRFRHVQPGEWHTGDFDSLWFARDSIPSLTLAAIGADGRMPNLHRPTDTLENVDPAIVRSAVDFAEATVRQLAGQSPDESLVPEAEENPSV